jgi:hypothetical protein
MVGGADAGALTMMAVVADAVSPWLSVTLQLTVMVPAAAPLVFTVALLPLPAMVPEETFQL